MTLAYQKAMLLLNSSSHLWIHDPPGSYSCPLAIGYLPSENDSWCQFSAPSDAFTECLSNTACIGVACGVSGGNRRLMCAATKIDFGNHPEINSSVHVKDYELVDMLDPEAAEIPGEYTCPAADNVYMQGELVNYCAFASQVEAQAHCNGDVKCMGVVCYKSFCKLTRKAFVERAEVAAEASGDSSLWIVFTLAGVVFIIFLFVCTNMKIFKKTRDSKYSNEYNQSDHSNHSDQSDHSEVFTTSTKALSSKNHV